VSTWATSGGIGGAKATVAIDDINATINALKSYGVEAKDLRAAMRPASRLLARAARKEVPVRDRWLKKSLRARPRATRADVVIGGRSAYYAPVVHFGWHRHNIEPNQFMFRALDANHKELIELISHNLHTLAREQGLTIT
jgi:hypothetical protein